MGGIRTWFVRQEGERSLTTGHVDRGSGTTVHVLIFTIHFWKKGLIEHNCQKM